MIKVLAIIFMLIDHVGYVFAPDLMILRIIGRLALPLFVYGLVQGFIRTKNVKKYFVRLFLLAVISQIPYDFVFNNGYYNILFTLCMGLLILILIESNVNIVFKLLGYLVIILISDIFYFEYGIYCLLLVVSFYLFKNNDFRLIIGIFIATLLSMLVYNYHIYQFAAILAIPIIYFLKSKDFKVPKTIGYGFYPVHLIVIAYIMTVYYN